MKKNHFESISQATQNPFSGHEFKKSLGQNFLRDTNLLKSIVRDAGVTDSDYVVEVGAGAGTLTRELADSAQKVLSFEVDRSLEPTLRELESNKLNLKIEFADALKTENTEILKLLENLAGNKVESYKVVANIPYYITTPLIFKFLKDPKVTSITVMVQKEVAERIASGESDPEYGGISAIVQYYGETSIKRVVKRDMFYPAPKVDSAILSIVKKSGVDHDFGERLAKVIKVSFQNRRKQLANNLSTGLNIEKSVAIAILTELNISATIRAEELSVERFMQLTRKLDEITKN